MNPNPVQLIQLSYGLVVSALTFAGWTSSTTWRMTAHFSGTPTLNSYTPDGTSSDEFLSADLGRAAAWVNHAIV